MPTRYLEIMGIGIASGLTASAALVHPPAIGVGRSAFDSGSMSPSLSLVAGSSSSTTEEQKAASGGQPSDEKPVVLDGESKWTVRRVGGIAEAELEQRAGRYRAGRVSINENLPEGYPSPTPPGAIELKQYPVVRRAQATMGTGDAVVRRENSAFFPLFRHIQSRGIPMTSPVEFIGEPIDSETAGSGDSEVRAGSTGQNLWSMAFLYESADSGPLENDGTVDVVDSVPGVFLSLGLRGSGGVGWATSHRAKLDEWLAGQTEWVAGEQVRVLSYNGPMVPPSRRWHELQIEVRRVAEADRPRVEQGGADVTGPIGEADSGN